MRGSDGLPDGLVLRHATVADTDAVVALNVAAFGDADAAPVRSHLTGPGADPSWWLVVADGGRIVAATARLPLTAHIDGVPIAASQLEWVATDPEHRRRGLVRAIFDRHHADAAADGELVQFIGGIPYFYRRLGYGYGLSYPDLYVFDPSRLRPDTAVSMRHAEPGDAGTLAAIDGPTPDRGVRIERTPDAYARWIDMCDPGSANQLWIASVDGRPVAWVRYWLDEQEGRLEILPPAAAALDGGTVDAIIAHAVACAGGKVVVAATEPGPFGARVRAVGTEVPYGLGVYVRVADPSALLEALRPGLSARLAAAGLAHPSHLDLSLYERGVRLHLEAGAVTGVEAVAGVEDPFDEQGVGIAPDWFPALVMGRWGASGLAERIDDVTLGRHASLMDVLFPRLDADVVTHF